ncbi:MAG: C25 family cysteine peptidase, partial [Candidatus Tenebribacter davisii]|nr:C25 family cysteine peptidase [Candidatus Tenebribacter davisii]
NIKDTDRKVSRFFEPIYRSAIMNYDSTVSRDLVYQDPSYLFIYPDAVLSYLEDISDWKHQKGFEVTLASTTETGTTNNSIKTYIQLAYDTWENPPEFVCLVGDVGGYFSIPTFSDTYSGYSGEGDHPYAQLEGNDVLEDVFLGRISIGDIVDMQTYAAKVLKYEKEPFMGETDWYDRAVLVGDPSSSGPSTIFTNQFVAELMHQYAPNIITTEVYSGNYANAMISNLNLGVTYLNYRGWIGMSGFDNSNINSLTNYRKLPFAVFLTCSTGNFASGESRSEAFIRAGSVGNQKGAIAAIGTATSGTHTNFNNCMDAGIYYGIFADGLYNPGGAVNRGKLALYEHYPQNPGNYVDIFSHWNTLIGDPGVELWTGVPQEIVADYETQIFPGTNYLEVTVTDDNGIPQGNAWVSALMGDDVIFVTGYTDANGVVYLPIEANTTGEMNLTITKHNFIPHLGMVQISNEALAISVYNYMVDDDNSGTSSGNEDEMINPGEDIELKVSLKNYGSQTASSITATISTDNDFITIADAVEDFGSIASGSSAFCTDDFDISIDEDVLGGTLIQLDILIEDGSGNQWNEVLFLMVEGINLYATDYIVFNSGNGVFDPGEDVEISVTLSNLGSVNATGIEGLLRCNNSGITISDSIGIFETISAGNSGNNNNDKFSVEASYQILPGSQIPFTLELTNSEGYNNTISFIIEVGVVSLEDPLGPDDYGYYCYDSDDIGYDSAPVYNWIEIDPSYGGSGISLNLYDGGDTGDTEDVDVPFSFNFYGRPYNMVSVCSNGWAVPGGSTQGSFMNSPIPGPQGPSPMISPFWDDLKTGSGNVFYFHDTTLHMFIVEWSHLQTDQTSDEETFQMMILDPLYYSTPTGDAEIIFQYKVVNNTSSGDYSSYHHDHGQYSSVGLEDHTGTVGLEYTFNNSYPTAAIHLQNDLALKFTTAGSIIQDPPISNFNYDSFNFVLSPGSIDTKYLEISNTGEANLVYNISKNYEQPEEGSGGPDSYGYIWTDSDEITGPEYSWRDISGVATEVIFTHNDVGTDLMPIGFDFIYYGEFYSEFRINPNGWIGFGDDNEEWNNLSLPHPNSPRPALIPFWDDLDPLQGGNVYYYSTADSLIIWFDDVIHFPGTYNGTYDFQVIIYEDGTILYQYRTMDGTLDSATIGLQNEVGNIALQMVYNGNFVENNYVVYIERIIDWVNLDQTFGYIPGGESNTISINVSAEELNIGDFLCDLFIVTNDPDANSITIPINLHVDTNVPIISLSTDILNFGDVLIGVDSSDTLFVSNLGEMDLEVTDITNGLAEFSASPVSFTLTPGETEEVIVTFTALEELLYEDVLIIESNDPYNSQYEVSLTGNGNHPADIDDQLPLVTKVGKNYPNPFNPETTIAFSIADNSKHVQLEIFNIKGQKVKTLVNKIMEVGEYNVVWNGKDYSGRKVASGVYFYKFDTKKYHRINKMLLIK